MLFDITTYFRQSKIMEWIILMVAIAVLALLPRFVAKKDSRTQLFISIVVFALFAVYVAFNYDSESKIFLVLLGALFANSIYSRYNLYKQETPSEEPV